MLLAERTPVEGEKSKPESTPNVSRTAYRASRRREEAQRDDKPAMRPHKKGPSEAATLMAPPAVGTARPSDHRRTLLGICTSMALALSHCRSSRSRNTSGTSHARGIFREHISR